MNKNYYIQKGTDPAKDIYADYSVIVMKTVGLTSTPPLKKVFIRDWADEQGEDTYIPTSPKFDVKKITITFRISKNTALNVKLAASEFLKYIIHGGSICYFDTYKEEGFRGYYVKNKLNNETYRETGSYIEFDLDFIASNGICEGFDNSTYSSMIISMISGTADFYFSDGTSILNVSESFIRNQSGGFVIYCPSDYGGVEIDQRISKVLGINGKVLGINGKLLGI